MSRFPWPARLVVLAAIWGMSFLFIKVGDEALAPLQVALARMLLGSATLLLILAARGDKLPRQPATWGHLIVAALILNAIPFSLFAYGETRTTSVLAGICNATTPLFTLPIAILMLGEERATVSRVVGVIIGFLGVLIVLGVWRGMGGSALLGNLACLAAAASYALGFPYARKYLAGRAESTVGLATAQLVCGTVELAILTVLVTRPPETLPLKVVASVAALGILGTGIAYILNYSLIRDAGATNASIVTYLLPLFSTVVGVLVLSEPLTWNEPAGALVVILGVAIAQNRVPLLSGQRRYPPKPPKRAVS